MAAPMSADELMGELFYLGLVDGRGDGDGHAGTPLDLVVDQGGARFAADPLGPFWRPAGGAVSRTTGPVAGPVRAEIAGGDRLG